MNDKFANDYSLHGHKQKIQKHQSVCLCFRSVIIISMISHHCNLFLIPDTIQKCPPVTLKDIEVVVGVYLAKAGDRLKRQH